MSDAHASPALRLGRLWLLLGSAVAIAFSILGFFGREDPATGTLTISPAREEAIRRVARQYDALFGGDPALTTRSARWR